MIDEIELVRRFREETPNPSADAWARARMAVSSSSLCSLDSPAAAAPLLVKSGAR
jgi:hypothetical protein